MKYAVYAMVGHENYGPCQDNEADVLLIGMDSFIWCGENILLGRELATRQHLGYVVRWGRVELLGFKGINEKFYIYNIIKTKHQYTGDK